MANRIILIDADTEIDNIRLVRRTALPMSISGLVPGTWFVHNTSESPPVIVEGDIPQIRPPALIGNRSIHSGHSLTDAYLSGNGHPGDFIRIRNAIFGDDSETAPAKIGKATIPGSPMGWRWDNTASPYDPKANAAQFDTLAITEGGPPPRTTDMGEWGMPRTLDYFCRFIANQIVNGAGDEVVLWSIWPGLQGPGTDDNNPTPSGTWAGFDFRTGCDEYWRSFKYMADHATWKIKTLYPALPADWRVWFVPGDRWMAQVYDDIQAARVPGITAISQIFDDYIHPNNIGMYGLGCFMASCLYQVDLRTVSEMYRPAGVTEEQAEYFWELAWDLANRFEHVGMGGAEGMERVWTPSMGDIIPDWTFEGAVIPEDPEDPEDPEEPGDIDGLVVGITPTHIMGLDDAGLIADISALLPPVANGALAPTPENTPYQHRRAINVGDVLGNNFHLGFRFRFPGGQPPAGTNYLMTFTRLPPTGTGVPQLRPGVAVGYNHSFSSIDASYEGPGSGFVSRDSAAGAMGTAWQTAEIACDGTTFRFSLNGEAWKTIPVSGGGGTITQALRYLSIMPTNGWSSIPPAEFGAILLTRNGSPTAEQRSAITAWLAAPSGGVARPALPAVPTPVLGVNRVTSLGAHGAAARLALGPVGADGFDVGPTDKTYQGDFASPAAAAAYMAVRIMLPEGIENLGSIYAARFGISAGLWDDPRFDLLIDQHAQMGVRADVSPGANFHGVPNANLTPGAWVTFEAMLTPAGSLSVTVNGGNSVTTNAAPKGATSKVLAFFNQYASEVRAAGVYIAQANPSEAERKAIRNWLEAS